MVKDIIFNKDNKHKVSKDKSNYLGLTFVIVFIAWWANPFDV